MHTDYPNPVYAAAVGSSRLEAISHVIEDHAYFGRCSQPMSCINNANTTATDRQDDND